LRLDEIGELTADHLVLHVASASLGAVVPFVDMMMDVLAEDRGVGGVDQSADVVGSGLRGVLGAAAVVDVHAGADDLERLARLVAQHHEFIAQPVVLTVGKPVAILKRTASEFSGAFVHSMDTSRVGGVDVVHPKIWIIEVALHRIAELRLDIWADVGAVEVKVLLASVYTAPVALSPPIRTLPDPPTSKATAGLVVPIIISSAINLFY
jgi:hypothetical protein